PTARRCFEVGRHLARVVVGGPWNVAVIATGGLSHFPELSYARLGTSDVAFDRRIVRALEAGDHEPLRALGIEELHETGSHALLASTARADEERDAFVRWDARRRNGLGGSLHLLVSVPRLVRAGVKQRGDASGARARRGAGGAVRRTSATWEAGGPADRG